MLEYSIVCATASRVVCAELAALGVGYARNRQSTLTECRPVGRASLMRAAVRGMKVLDDIYLISKIILDVHNLYSCRDDDNIIYVPDGITFKMIRKHGFIFTFFSICFINPEHR